MFSQPSLESLPQRRKSKEADSKLGSGNQKRVHSLDCCIYSRVEREASMSGKFGHGLDTSWKVECVRVCGEHYANWFGMQSPQFRSDNRNRIPQRGANSSDFNCHTGNQSQLGYHLGLILTNADYEMHGLVEKV